MKKVLFPAVMAAALLAAEAVDTPDYQVTVSSGVNYLSGDYGQTTDTTIVYIPVTVKVKRDNWTARLTVPYLRITGPGVVVGGADGAIDVGTAGVKDTQSGLGDVVAALTYNRLYRRNRRYAGDRQGLYPR